MFDTTIIYGSRVSEAYNEAKEEGLNPYADAFSHDYEVEVEEDDDSLYEYTLPEEVAVC